MSRRDKMIEQHNKRVIQRWAGSLSGKLLAQQRFEREKLRKQLERFNRMVARYNARTKQRIERADRAELYGTAEKFMFVQQVRVAAMLEASFTTAVSKWGPRS